MYSLNQLVAINHKRQWILMDTETCLPLLYPLRYHIDHLAFVHCPRSLLRCRPLSSFTNFGCRNTASRFAIASMLLATTRALLLRKCRHFLTIWRMVA